ncbi:Cilia- and flagella-associated protein 161 [Clonorchis sinensis]|uniref:Cilia- and flagella-associated protein 161 n=1 Tax=Clonorchis sinensis TaxID=79923 RepID=A0A8T1MCF6_CLOSI|nr:Cilia- and flagella-associated protein 161 [Clonorchis sinensis]
MTVVRPYSYNVLLGNWWEERLHQSDLLKAIGAQNQLKSKLEQSLEQLAGKHVSTDYQFSGIDEFVRIGSEVQLINPGISEFYRKAKLSSPRPAYALAFGVVNLDRILVLLSIGADNILESMYEEKATPVVATSNLSPASRSMFRIESPDPEDYGRALRYGQPVMFSLQPEFGPVNKEKPPKPFYLASQLSRLGDPLCQSGAQMVLFEQGEPSYAAHWEIVAADCQLRHEKEGRLVKMGDKILIRHIRTNKPLALEPKFPIRTISGRDIQVSANAYYDSHRAERDVNIWTLSRGVLSRGQEEDQMESQEKAKMEQSGDEDAEP